MKKYLLLIGLFFLCWSCSKPSDCVESSGPTVTKTFEVTPFTRLFVNQGIEVVIKQGSTYQVVVETGQNLIDAIAVTQDASTLYLKDNTTCNWVRDFGQTKIFITAPNIENIYSKTNQNISSDGILLYPVLRLFAFDQESDGLNGAGSGDFYLAVNNSQLVIETNTVARFYISGFTDEALFNFYSGDARIESQNLNAQNIKVFHRGSNDMIVRPIQKIEGKLVSTGNIILKNNPPINTLQSLYTGQIIFN